MAIKIQGQTVIDDNQVITLTHSTEPDSPENNRVSLYSKNNEKLYAKNNSGVELELIKEDDIPANKLSNLGLSGLQLQHGHPFPYTVILSYDPVTRQASLTPTNSVFSIWLSGVEHIKTGVQTSPAHTNITDNYFIYYDSLGELQFSTTPWDLNGAAIPVCYVYYNADIVDAIPLFELHTSKRNAAWHKSQHFAIGTYIKSGFEISGYILNTETDASLTIGIASGVVVDEDIDYTLTELLDGGPYTIFYRTGPLDWTWTTNTFPFLFAPGSYIRYNQDSGGDFQMTTTVAARWINYYVFCTTALPHTLTNGIPISTSTKRFLFIPGQAVHTSLSLAQAESISSLSWGGILIPEIVGVWKITFRTLSGNSTSGKVRLVEVTRITASKSQLTGNFTIGSHNSLLGRDAIDSHPASAITNTPAGNIAALSVQEAINELDTEKQITLVSGTNIKTINTFSLLGSGDITISGGGSGLFNTNLSSITGYAITNTMATAYTAAATAGLRYMVHSIHVTNINGTASADISGQFVGTTYSNIALCNTVPVPAGTSVELLKKPKILQPNDVIQLQASLADYLHAVIVVEISDGTELFGEGIDITLATTYTTLHTATADSVIESILLVNDNGAADVKVRVVWSDNSDVIQGYFSYDIIVPADSTVEILEQPKFLPNTHKIRVYSNVADRLEAIIAGKIIT